MKAAVLHQLGQTPQYDDFPDPVPQNADEIVLAVKAAAVKNIDKLRAGGTHYASYTKLPVVVGIDGVGDLEYGTRVYAAGVTGMIAQKALIRKGQYVVLPAGLDESTAAALPNAGMGAAMALPAVPASVRARASWSMARPVSPAGWPFNWPVTMALPQSSPPAEMPTPSNS